MNRPVDRKWYASVFHRAGRPIASVLSLAVLGLLFSVLPAGSQGRNLPPATGRLLVATERLVDPRFSETVILLVNVDQKGAMGLILNRPTRLSIGEGLPFLPELAEGDHGGDPIHFGGPVSVNLPLALLKTTRPPNGSTTIKNDLVLTSPTEIAPRVGGRDTDDEQFRIFAGYSGWRAGQLEGEIGRGDWEVIPFDPQAIFPRDPGSLWEKIRTKEQRIWI